jgi:O-6-methylguanine DNA methyltransferase
VSPRVRARKRRDEAAPAAVRYGSRQTALGRVWVAVSEEGVVLVAVGGAPVGQLAAEVKKRKAAQLVHDPAGVAKLLDDLEATLDGRAVSLARYKLDPSGLSDFRRRVYAAARDVPYGARASYRALAAQVASPRHAHAVGAAMAANPFRLLVPDHRVILARGATGESRLGRGLKARLLALEAGQQDLAWTPREGRRS